MTDINAVAKQFTDFYYTTFDTNRASLQGLYPAFLINASSTSVQRAHSMLTFEGSQILGVTDITEKLTSLPFQKVQHKVTTLDAQPSDPTMSNMIVSVTGLLLVDDNENPLQFSQVFQLVPEGGSFYVFNDIFRLNYGA
ncbi:nuclear transport factor 2 [Daedalea quercina L-15889]|uniref:NTF2-related export protein n=1 Tax=Daedalea quercina L-15889 TaxID=1314783 RepID=A0A165R269_9APHY|nr:nuclear transport factor 2 [Daedalea quercina L-15889]